LKRGNTMAENAPPRKLIYRMSEKSPAVIRRVLDAKGWAWRTEEDDKEIWDLWWKTQRFKASEVSGHVIYPLNSHLSTY
jgi:hypothetical protein